MQITDCKADYVWVEGDAASYIAAMLDGWCMASGIHMNVMDPRFPSRTLHCNEMMDVIYFTYQSVFCFG